MSEEEKLGKAVEVVNIAELRELARQGINDKVGTYAKHKKYVHLFRKLGDKYLTKKQKKRAETCGDILKLGHNITFTKSKVINAMLCGIRWCPLCSWLRSLKLSMELGIEMFYLHKVKKLEFILVTLTVQNVCGAELEQGIKDLNKAYKRFVQSRAIQNISYGEVRKLEVTKSPSLEDSYHPHLHVLAAVNKNYFSSNNYLHQDDILQLWRRCTRNDTIVGVDVRTVDTSNFGAVLEMAKYGAKSEDYLASQTDFDVFYKALKGKQLLSKGGVFAEAQKMWNNGELDYLLTKDNTEYIYGEIKAWYYKPEKNAHEYSTINKYKLSVEEYIAVNKDIALEIIEQLPIKEIRHLLEELPSVEEREKVYVHEKDLDTPLSKSSKTSINS